MCGSGGHWLCRLQRQVLQLPLIAQINQSEAAVEGGTHDTFVWVKVEQREQLKIAYHPRFAAEVVDGEERVAAWDAAEMQADHKVPEILTGDHAVGVLANQDEVWLKGPAARQTWIWVWHGLGFQLYKVLGECKLTLRSSMIK